MSRHPLLAKRDKGYSERSRHRLLHGDDGSLAVSPMPKFVDLIGLRPLTLEEQVARFTAADVTDFNLVPDEKFLSEDDFHDYLDDLPDEGWSPYELAGFDNILRSHEMGRGYASREPADGDDAPAPTPLPSTQTERAAKPANEPTGSKGSGASAPDGEAS